MLKYTKNYRGTVYHIEEFDSMSEVAEYIENTENINKYSLVSSSYLRMESGFLGISSFDGIISRLKFGDEKITTKYLDKLENIRNESSIDNSTYRMDIEGVAYDMGAVVAGEPECCINLGAPDTKPYLKIYIDTGYCGRVSPETINNRGIAIFQLISNLVARGYILDIYIIHYITVSEGEPRFCAQLVKLSTEYLVTSQLAFGGTCEFFRVVTWLLTAIQIKRKSYTGEGKSEPRKEVIEEFKKDGLYIPSGYTDCRFDKCTLKEATDLVTEIYNEYTRKEAKCA